MCDGERATDRDATCCTVDDDAHRCRIISVSARDNDFAKRVDNEHGLAASACDN